MRAMPRRLPVTTCDSSLIAGGCLGQCSVFQLFRNSVPEKPEFGGDCTKNAAFFNFSEAIGAKWVGKVEKRCKTALEPPNLRALRGKMSEKLKFHAGAKV